MSKMEYKNGMILGLLISAAPCAGFYPAADIKIYCLFLGLLFILGIGFILLQLAVSPYVALLGKQETASSRLNLAQARNSLFVMMILGGARIPLVQGWFADVMGGYHTSFFIPIICYIYLALYGLKGHSYVIKKGLI